MEFQKSLSICSLGLRIEIECKTNVANATNRVVWIFDKLLISSSKIDFRFYFPIQNVALVKNHIRIIEHLYFGVE